MSPRVRCTTLAALLAIACAAVVFAATRSSPQRLDAEGFALAVPPYAFSFPRDHASHPAFRIEWWYYTGHLAARDRRFGFEMTFFRFGLPRVRESSPSAWAARDLVFLHLALTDERGRRFLQHDEARRVALGLAGADSTRYHVWLGASSATLGEDEATHRLRGVAPEFALDLALAPRKPAVVHGKDGVSQKTPGEGRASHYYSLTRMEVEGRLGLGRDTLAVTGLAWMDHEFASHRLADTHAGWDWFSVQLDDGRDLMLYQLRRRDGTVEPLSSGTLVAKDGGTRVLASSEFRVTPRGEWTSPRTGGRYPSGWTIDVPGESLSLTLEPVLADQELVARAMGGIVYWEGRCRVRGTARGVAVGGDAYVELTGYVGGAPY